MVAGDWSSGVWSFGGVIFRTRRGDQHGGHACDTNKSHGTRVSDKPLPNLARTPLPPSVDPGGHGGAEGRLMNEFVTAILQDRTPWCNIAEALNMAVAGIVVSQSARKDGELLRIPQFALPT